jgi:hypothetical protein
MASYLDGMNDYLSGTGGKGYSLTNGLKQVGDAYMQNLGRTPEQGAMGWYEQQIAGGADINQLLSGIGSSPEAQAFKSSGATNPFAQPPGTPVPQIPQSAPAGGMNYANMDTSGAGAGYSGSNPYLGANPHLSAQADDIGRRTQLGLGQAFNQGRSNAVGVGGLGGSRQGVFEAQAAGQAMDSLQGQLANLYGTDWTNQQNRDLQRYGIDTSAQTQRHGIDTAQILGMTNAANQRHATDVGNLNTQQSLDNQRYGIDTGFYTAQRGQDLAQILGGANLVTQGVEGGWLPIENASDIFNSVAGNNINQTNSSQQGGGAVGALGGMGAFYQWLNSLNGGRG